MTFKQVASWGVNMGVKVERVGRKSRMYEVWTNGAEVHDCRTLDEVVQSVYELSAKSEE